MSFLRHLQRNRGNIAMLSLSIIFVGAAEIVKMEYAKDPQYLSTVKEDSNLLLERKVTENRRTESKIVINGQRDP